MTQITIKVSEQDLDLLKRIAASKNRRFADFCQLIFAEGINYFFCDEGVSIKRTPEEYTEEDRQQEAKNEELEKQDGFYRLSIEERKAQGWKHVCQWLQGDALIDPIVERLKAYALD